MNWIVRKLKQHQEEEAERRSFFVKNGGILLEKLIQSSRGKYYPYRCFSLKEIKAATNDFNAENLINVSSDEYKLYKGLVGDRLVSVMVVTYKDYRENDDFYFNNIVFSAQLSHKNAPKLIGCCLETEIPIVVFEYINHGSLEDRIGINSRSPLSWNHRLKIAMEIANVVANLHVKFSRPIIFRDIKPHNILFDEENNAKLFDFSLCISIPEDKTYVEDVPYGTFGYVDPEYMQSGHCSEKSDVYSFGILLLVFLTGQKVFSWKEKYSFLRDRIFSIKSSRFEEMIDVFIIGDGLSQERKQQLQYFTTIAMECTMKSPEDRPTMIEVAKEMRKLYLSCIA